MTARELVDVVDENDTVIGQVPRAQMRRQRLRHRSVYILVFNNKGRLFIHRRTATKDVYPSHWDVAVGGVVAAGESYDDGAKREVSEEIGFTSVELTRLFPFRYEDEHARVNGMVYVCRSDQALRLQAEEIEAGKWVDPADVPRLANEKQFCPDGLAVFEQYRDLGNETRGR